jgi:hypothetical protein
MPVRFHQKIDWIAPVLRRVPLCVMTARHQPAQRLPCRTAFRHRQQIVGPDVLQRHCLASDLRWITPYLCVPAQAMFLCITCDITADLQWLN